MEKNGVPNPKKILPEDLSPLKKNSTLKENLDRKKLNTLGKPGLNKNSTLKENLD